ncbi:type I-MYXAN CRISPR-associated protein Cas5/Cmx5/DevS [Coleofasciculus sp. FACHB-64]|uniref:type I-MYXAN CRISPR-associated protein Cas5/Cmx5/DevS n=1 Tax=Cyanophyceae TaxID=3028117 RepID=UPI00168776DB|nr:type I-MYXAN CRISPR-associated protein Cas5/Cmx5/DevS [Coleofasciculus sp. FACHB-64]
MTTIALKVEVPIACFRQSRVREYAETYPMPPPSTVYGMLLSLVGEMNRYKHCGVKLAIALLSEPEKSTVIRTFHRFKTKNIHDPKNTKPDYQELLTNIEFIAWVDAGVDKAKPNLVQRLEEAFTNPASINRFGGLCLGESRDLVNDVTLLPENYYAESMRWLIRDEYSSLTLPYWVDHVGSRGTRWLRYGMQESQVFQPPELAWTSVQSD